MTDVHEGELAVHRLRGLSLTMDDLEYALAVGDNQARYYRTENDPPSMSGLARWAGTVRGLRNRLVPRGWHKKNPRNLPVTLAPDHSFGIVSVTGNEYTGIRGFTPPSPVRPPGLVTLQAIGWNLQQFEPQLQLPFGDEELELMAEDSTGGIGSRILWILLYRESQDKIWAELSQPLLVEGGVVERWQERILVPTYSPHGEVSP
ncbi:hypothetical protein ACFQZ2_19305 [Streptomonospora algeriensis]|uniref:Uncharacterized protein n=1 Tax=Streptomonospora algeriensis TaxID=995084 RepID=A0ABW3BKS4_9ACTN